MYLVAKYVLDTLIILTTTKMSRAVVIKNSDLER